MPRAPCCGSQNPSHNLQSQGLPCGQAYERVTSIRPCGPKRDAVRGATFDLLDGRPHAAFGALPDIAYAFLNDHDRSRLQVQ